MNFKLMQDLEEVEIVISFKKKIVTKKRGLTMKPLSI
jgi:hypothetical protein